MGLTNSKEFLSGKFTSAIIIDKGNRAFSVPIRSVIDDYFVVTIEKQRYVFKLDGQRIITWRQKARKTMRFVLYTTDHYLPMSVQDNKEIEMVLSDNSLPKINHKLLELFLYLGKKEKTITKDKPFVEHDLEKVVEMVEKEESEFPEMAKNMQSFFERLDAKKIITPVKRVGEFLDAELRTTDAKIFGDIEGQVKRTEKEQRAMSNTVVDAKKPWLIIAIIGIFIVGVAIFGIWAWQSGALGHIGLPTIGGQSQAPTTASIIQKYPTPEALKAALDRGEIKLSDLPPEAKSMLENYHPPIATPIPKGQH